MLLIDCNSRSTYSATGRWNVTPLSIIKDGDNFLLDLALNSMKVLQLLIRTSGQFFDRIPPPHLSPFVDNKEETYVVKNGEATEHLKVIVNKEVLHMLGLEIHDMDILRKIEDRASERLPYSAANQGKNANIVDGEMRNYQRATERQMLATCTRLCRVAAEGFA
ncbi:hypothetical protein MKW98_015739 [Papaver atlanticum]|uniref:Uncharacterized protein n=1 Tax=Papaver atlanticum TaxID=357466 RepID=A0AAD4XF76_9MAGN|nr:hypothetical protein MKW98_015739 [Papaver atlanticum]